MKKISLKVPSYEDYETLYSSRFSDEVVYWADAYRQDLSLDEFAMGRLFLLQDSSFFERIICLGTETIGTITAREIDWDQRCCVLSIVIALPVHWGKGYGPRALRQFIILLQEKGIKLVFLETYQNNTRARKCFERLGFRKNRSFFAPNSGRFIIEMSLSLEQAPAIGYVVVGGRRGSAC